MFFSRLTNQEIQQLESHPGRNSAGGDSSGTWRWVSHSTSHIILSRPLSSFLYSVVPCSHFYFTIFGESLWGPNLIPDHLSPNCPFLPKSETTDAPTNRLSSCWFSDQPLDYLSNLNPKPTHRVYNSGFGEWAMTQIPGCHVAPLNALTTNLA